MVIGIQENILPYYEQLVDDPNHRYRSWEHCYSYFQGRRSFNTEEDIDMATLHLAFYLASWGMYRGSSKLLQKDYRVHTPVVREILDDRYASLWQLDFDSVSARGREVALVFELVDRLRRIYRRVHVSPTNTLVTKVLLGTLCCTPAYDQLFKSGVRAWSSLCEEGQPRFPKRLGRNSYLGLIDFYGHNKKAFQTVQATIEEHSGIVYPVMKLIDMFFWNLGWRNSSRGN